MASLKKLVVLTLLAAVARASDAGAQDTSRVVSPDAASNVAAGDSSTKSGPRIAPSGVQRSVEAGAVAALAQKPQSMGKPMALMIVGGASFVLGALIGSEVGTLFMLGGAIAFLIGLYEYVR
jgi:hypothetical protein